MSLLCLIGRHGSGKSSIGAAMTPLGYTHLSVGLLRRLAGQGQYPADVPALLMTAMRRAQPGRPLDPDTCRKLLKHALSLPNCVIDGFPASREHLALLPTDSAIGVVWTPRSIREDRLVLRAAGSLRQWTPGRHSERESALASVILAARLTDRLLFVANRDSGNAAIAALAKRVAELVR